MQLYRALVDQFVRLQSIHRVARAVWGKARGNPCAYEWAVQLCMVQDTPKVT